MPPTTKQVSAFWDWFATHRSHLASLLSENDSEGLYRELTGRLKELGLGIGWELGPGEANKYALSFTLNGLRENIDHVDRILAMAPSLAEWEFNCGRPRRSCPPEMVFESSDGNSVIIRLSEWQYVLRAFDNASFFDVSVYAPQLAQVDSVGRNQITRTALQLVLGERDAMKVVDRIHIVEHPDDDFLENATPFQYLASHIDDLTAHLE